MTQKGKHVPNTTLRRLREERGWSLRRVADELCLLAEAEDENRIPGVNANMVGVWERGWKRPSPFYQELFCQLYHRSASQLGFVHETDTLAPARAEGIPQQEVNSPLSPLRPATSFPQLARTHEQTCAIDLLCHAPEAAPEQQVGAWLTLGASGLSQLFHEGWTLEEILASLQVVLQGIQFMPSINRRQLLQLGGTAAISSIPVPVGERVSEEERVRFTHALGESIGAAWKLFHTAGNAQVLAVGQALLCLVQQNHSVLPSNDRSLFYSGIYNLTGIALSFQEHYESALQAHNSAYLAALQSGASWGMIQSLICQADRYQALGQQVRAIQVLEEALRVIGDNPPDEAHLRSKAHLLACWADNAMTLGETAIVQEKLDASAPLLEQIGSNEEFDHASWFQLAGKFAFMTGDYAKTIEYYEQAIVKVPSSWVLRRALLLIPMVVAYACQRERDASLMLAEQTLSTIRILDAPIINRQFMVAVNQALVGAFPGDAQVQGFISEVFR